MAGLGEMLFELRLESVHGGVQFHTGLRQRIENGKAAG